MERHCARPDPGRLHLPRPVHRSRPHLRRHGAGAERRRRPGGARRGPLSDPRPRLRLREGPGCQPAVLRGRRAPSEARNGLGCGRRHGSAAEEDRQRRRGDHPRRSQRREPRRRADALRVRPLPQPRGGDGRQRRSAPAALPGGAPARHEALPVDDPDRLPDQGVRVGGRHRRLREREEDLRGRGAVDQHADDADRVLGTRTSPMPTGRSTRRSASCSRSRTAAGTSAGRSRASGSPTSAGSTTSASSRGRRQR
jgi:hypothetical protein